MTRKLLLLLVLFLTACGEKQYNEIELMPSPVSVTSGAIDPFKGDTGGALNHDTLFYATDRAPATPEDASDFYANRRGQILRVGTAEVTMSPPITTLGELRELTLSSESKKKRTLSVTGINEIGPLPIQPLNPLVQHPDAAVLANTKAAFRNQINRQLALSGGRDAYIYVHGYNVDFEYPTLAAKELHHYLGYRGAFISYNWPATPKRLAYLRDLETADATRRNLRSLIEFLSSETNVRRVHLIGYSAGSRLAFETTYQIALQRKAGHSPARLGQVILVASDLDRGYFAEAVADGLLDAVDRFSLYLSGSDSALALSRFLFGRNRLGQVWESTPETAHVEEALAGMEKLSLIDVTDAPGAATGNGHWYFRSSPWSSSDILLSLMHGQAPQNRGLERTDGPVWRFPANYPERLHQLYN